MNHLTQEQLLECAGLSEKATESRDFAAHINACAACRARLEFVRKIERELQRVPVSAAPASIVGSVLRQLGIPESPSSSWMFLKYLSPLIAIIVVLVPIYFVTSLNDPGSGVSVQKSLVDVEKLRVTGGAVLQEVTTGVTQFLNTYLAYAPKGKASWLTLYVCLLLAGIGLLDRYILGPLHRRRR